MITYVSSKDAKLFELAAEALNETSLTLDQYLSRLGELKTKSPKFVRLPLYEEGHEDEEIFEINANERTIKVPASFSKNGVGVVSDELAETVWFKINRYFDLKDFGQAVQSSGDELKDGCLHILIQWEAPDGAHGASWAYAVDTDTDPDFVYFGWALTADHLTAKAGNIKFGVRILQYDGDEIAYSFATQAAQVAVKPGLSFDLTKDEVAFESVADKIASRIMSGEISHAPVFAPKEDPDDPEDFGGNLPPYILSLAENGGSVELSVEADAPKKRVEDSEHPGTFIEVDDPYDAVVYKWYHKAPNEDEFRLLDDKHTPALTVTSSGEYYVVVFGMKEIVDGMEMIYDDRSETAVEGKFKYHTSVASSKSTVCMIPAPIKLQIAENIADWLVLENEPALTIKVKRQAIDGTVVGDITLKAERTDGEDKADKDLDLSTATFIEVPATAVAEITGEEEGIYYTITNTEPDENGDVYGTIAVHMENAAEAYYRFTVIHTLNGSVENTPGEGEANTAICRAVGPAVAPTNVEATVFDKNNVEVTDREGSWLIHDRIRASFDIDGLSDNVTIQWYLVNNEPDPDDEMADEAILNANGMEYIPTEAGLYYFIVTNEVLRPGSTTEKTTSSTQSAHVVFGR